MDRKVSRCVRGGIDVSSAAFADDVNAYVSTLADVAAAEAAFATFGAASGLRLSREKLKGFILGAPDPGLQAYGSFTAVETCRVLGVTVESGTGQPITDWDSRLATLRKRCDTLSVCGLPSVFCRAQNASTYGLQAFSFQAEYASVPPQEVVLEARKIIAKFVDRGLAQSSKRKKFSGLSGAMLEGPPIDGGIGVA
jgi:hypothetical protein